MLRRGLILLSLLIFTACNDTHSPHNPMPKQQPEEDLQITFGGFRKDGPTDQVVDGICGTNVERDTLECDVHNGLMDWTISELTFQVIRADEVRNGDEDNSPHHYYRQAVAILPLQTSHIAMSLGMQLPRDEQMKFHNRPVGTPIHRWSWLIVDAKGHRNE